ncbi:MAG: molybdopterin-dependent oxidoreductase [Candidatus Dormibacteraeota bacterium]|nr:molybdopterin-dependent oxidoreductase [Candidatus Dormibacteraeota bacterium]
MGSNMAECHPVGFQWVMEAKLRGATVMHVDPRFTRTSAVSSFYAPVRAGSDTAFLGGIVNYILENRREFREYLVQYTNAPVILNQEFKDSEDLDGYFSGWNAEEGEYQPSSWQYQGMQEPGATGRREHGHGRAERAGAGGGLTAHAQPPVDPTLEHPDCVFQHLKRHYARYTPELVARTCGCTEEQFLRVARTLCDNSGRERTSAIVYSVGWTQHTVGVQIIRTASIIQLLLGNIGRPGGGILALRGHASIQGSTDIPTLYNLLPGYIPMPHAHESFDLDEFIANYGAPTGGWGKMRNYLVSLLKAYWGEHATADNQFCWEYLPRIDKDDSAYRSALGMLEGKVKGFFCVGENPAVGSSNAKLHRKALANLDWLVVRDLYEIESASFWYNSPEIEGGELRTDEIGTEVFLLPASAHTEKDGSFTNAQRLLQWHHQAVEPKGDCRSDLWFYFHLGRIIRQKLQAAQDASQGSLDRPILDLSWDYPTHGPQQEPDAEAVLAEISGWRGPGREPVSTYLELKDDGSTACGCWIYSGTYKDGINQVARRRPWTEQSWVASEWGWAWPSNRRILYNRASADPEGRPWSDRKRYLWWDPEQGKWLGEDTPDFTPTKPPDYQPPQGATAEEALPGTAPFIMQGDGRGWLHVPSGLVDGPMPAHFEPHESPVTNQLYPELQSNPARQVFERAENRSNPTQGSRYPYVLTTYRLTEHHTAGGMSRTLPVLTQLQPELFCEVSPELAAERGLRHGDWAVISTERASIEARVMVTERMASLTVEGRRVHQVGVPYHWGRNGLTTGDSANDLLPIVLDPNVHIQESKAATCDIQPGRRSHA